MRALRGITDFLTLAIVAMALSGGFLWKSPYGKIEFSSLDPWVLALAILVACGIRFGRIQEREFGVFGSLWKRGERLLSDPARSRKNAAWVLGLGFGLLFLAHVLKHLSLHTHGLDVSYVHQSLFHPFAPKLLHCDVCPGETAFGTHLTYAFFLLSPLTSWWHSDFLVFFLQASMLGGAVWLALRSGPLRSAPALLFFGAVLALSHRGLRASVVWDFREDGIAFAALFGMLLSARAGRALPLLVLLLLAVSAKENVWAVTLFFAPALLLSRETGFTTRRRWILAIVAASISLGYGFLAFRYLIPHYIPGVEGSHPLLVRYGEYGATPREIVYRILTSPLLWPKILFGTLLSADVLKYLLFAVGPFAFFFARTREARVWLLPALPGVFMNITHGYAIQRSLQFHYELLFLPFLIWASWTGMKELQGRPRVLFWGLLLALGLSGRWPLSEVTSNWPSMQEIQASRFLSKLPESRVLAISMRLSAQVNRLQSFRILGLPGEGEGWSEFVKKNNRPMDGVSSRPPWDAEWAALDLLDGPERFVTEAYLARGWKELGRSDGGKIILLERPFEGWKPF